METATSQGRPQLITKRGKNSAVLLSYDEYVRLLRPNKTVLESLMPDGLKKRRLESWLSDKIMPQFSQRILSVDLEVALVWGQVLGELYRRGFKLAAIDGLLAATALHHRLTLVTRNEKDFAATDVQLVNPWS